MGLHLTSLKAAFIAVDTLNILESRVRHTLDEQKNEIISHVATHGTQQRRFSTQLSAVHSTPFLREVLRNLNYNYIFYCQTSVYKSQDDLFIVHERGGTARCCTTLAFFCDFEKGYSSYRI